MRKKIFGQTGVELSALGFGCMRLPLLDPADPTAIDEEQATAMLRLAVDRGVNYVDTAYPYHSNDRLKPGHSELFVGRALKDGYREKVHLATKLPSWLVKSRRQMDELLDEQLTRLQTSHLDFYLAHNLNNLVWPGIKEMGLFDFLDGALKDGRIKHAGFSFHDRYELFEKIVGSYDWSFAQIQYNYLDTEYQAGRRGAQLVRSKGMGLAVMEPLRGGMLVNHLPEEAEKILREIRPDRSLAEWGLRWVLDQPEVGVTLSGVSSLEQIRENLDIADRAGPLAPEETEALARVRDFFHQRVKVNCTGCGYCLPCPQGVAIPKNFIYFNDYYLVDSQLVRDRAKYFFRVHASENETFEHCVHCRECEEKCPQNLPISDLLEEMGRIFTRPEVMRAP